MTVLQFNIIHLPNVLDIVNITVQFVALIFHVQSARCDNSVFDTLTSCIICNYAFTYDSLIVQFLQLTLCFGNHDR